MRTRKRALFSLLVLALGSQWLCVETEAIPPFARKYQTSCQTCRVIVPKLNSFGEAFRLNKQVPDTRRQRGAGEGIAGRDGRARLETNVSQCDVAQQHPGAAARWHPHHQPRGMDARCHLRAAAQLRVPTRVRILGRRTVLTSISGFSASWSLNRTVRPRLCRRSWSSTTSCPGPGPAGTRAVGSRRHYGSTTVIESQQSYPRGAGASVVGNRTLSDWRLLEGATVRRSDNTFRLQNNQPAIELNGILARRLY